MADYDVADLLARCKRYAKRPATDEAFSDPDWYAMLTEAEGKWKPILALHLPEPMFNAPTQLTTSDGGLTYDFPGETDPPLAVEIFSRLNGVPLNPGAFHDPAADYVIEGTSIRMVRGTARSFSDGPYARWISAPGAIDDSTDSTIQPARYRILLVFDALRRWASIGGYRDPAYYKDLLQKELYGDPDIPGDAGILGDKAQNYRAGMSAHLQSPPYRWWHPRTA